MKLDLFLISSTKIYSECIRDLNVRGKTIKLRKENTEVNLHDLELGIAFSDTTAKAKMTKEKDKFIFELQQNLQLLCIKRYYQKVESNKVLESRLYKELLQVSAGKDE